MATHLELYELEVAQSVKYEKTGVKVVTWLQPCDWANPLWTWYPPFPHRTTNWCLTWFPLSSCNFGSWGQTTVTRLAIQVENNEKWRTDRHLGQASMHLVTSRYTEFKLSFTSPSRHRKEWLRVSCPVSTLNIYSLDRASKFFSIFIWMISDAESSSRRIPTLVQYCQRGEFHCSDAVGILVLTGFLPFDSRFCSCRMFVLRFTFRTIQLIGGFSHQQSWRCAALPAGQTNTRELRCRTSP